MNATITQADLVRLRMRAQGLTTPVAGAGSGPANRAASGPERIAATASRMLAVQGQDWRSARWALGARTPGSTLSDVNAAFEEGRIVRSWPMRGTIHVVAAEDIGWMQGVTNHRVLAGAVKRRAQLGLSDSTLDRLTEVALAGLRGGASLSREELSELWASAEIEMEGPWRYHTIWWLCQNGLAVFGPPGPDGEPRLVLADEWIRHRRTLEGDEALAELAARYTEPRGPIHRKDFAWWTGLTMREADRGLALAAEAGRVTPVELHRDVGANTETLWVSPEVLDSANETPLSPSWLLLPGFDEHLLGYTSRDAQLDPEHFDRIVPGRNGMFLATVVHAGRVVGTWKRPPGKKTRIRVTPFPGAHIDLSSLEPEAARWASFQGFEQATLEMGELQ